MLATNLLSASQIGFLSQTSEVGGIAVRPYSVISLRCELTLWSLGALEQPRDARRHRVSGPAAEKSARQNVRKSARFDENFYH